MGTEAREVELYGPKIVETIVCIIFYFQLVSNCSQRHSYALSVTSPDASNLLRRSTAITDMRLITIPCSNSTSLYMRFYRCDGFGLA